jgi:hypothetical protein
LAREAAIGAIIWLASYPKSGNTWLRAFLCNLLQNPSKPLDINRLGEFISSDDRRDLYEAAAGAPLDGLSDAQIAALCPWVQASLAQSAPNAVFVKTHAYLGTRHGTPQINLEVTAGTIYVVRNPLDVVISLADHYGFGLDRAVDALGTSGFASAPNENRVAQVIDTWSVHVESWTRTPHPTLHVVRYEDMLAKPEKTFGAIAAFLQLSPPRARLRKAIEFSSFRTLKKQEAQHGFAERSPVGSRFFREGRSGQWRKVLSPQQVDRIVADHGEQMERFGYLP